MAEVKTFTLYDQLKDEEAQLLRRLSIIRNRIAHIESGRAVSDSVRVTVAVGAQSVSVASVKSAGVGN